MHRRWVLYSLSVVCAWLNATRARGDDTEIEGLVAAWRFEDVDSRSIIDPNSDKDGDEDDERLSKIHYFVRDELADAPDELEGFHSLVKGVSGNALRLGGIDAFIARTVAARPALDGEFTIESWIAIGAYSVGFCPILADADNNRGYLFGIDAHGRIRVDAEIDGEWVRVVSDEAIPIGEWAHVGCTYQTGKRLAIYLNGRQVGEQPVSGKIDWAEGQTLLIGKRPIKRRPQGTIRNNATNEVHAYFDGLLDELRVYDRALTAADMARAYAKQRLPSPPDLPTRRLPSGPEGPGAFGAYYSTLKYYDAWDAQWRMGENADVVVRFEDHAGRFVFWRGTNYVPHWVTENGIWYDNAFNETWGEHGCQEPMSDKQCRHSQVRILESHEARVVVLWRYALVDNWYKIAGVKGHEGWGDWTEEIYTVYPDAIGVREVTLLGDTPKGPHEWQESIVVMGPGQRPETVLEEDAVTVVNMEGDSHVYSWIDRAPETEDVPVDGNIQIVNTKSTYKPVAAFPSSSDPAFVIFDAEIRPDVSPFPWWNHWPTAFDPCDGRFATKADRASHAALSHWYWGPSAETETTMTKIMLNGLTKTSPKQAARLTRSWDAAPPLAKVSEGFADEGYDPGQRAYRLRRTTAVADSALTFQVAASDHSPIVNLALVIQSWGDRDIVVSLDGSAAKFRAGHRTNLDETDLVVWIEADASQATSIEVRPVD